MKKTNKHLTDTAPNTVAGTAVNESAQTGTPASAIDKKAFLLQKVLPCSLGVFAFVFDQLTKFIVEKTIPLNTIGASFLGDFFRIIHVTNTGAAFSIGNSFSEIWRLIVLCILPLMVLLFVLVIYFKSDDFTPFQRWAVCGIIGGGFGNLVDRFFRPFGVVDFLDVKFYGLFGLDRWPTFNVADSFVLVCAILVVISFVKTFLQGTHGESSAKAAE